MVFKFMLVNVRSKRPGNFARPVIAVTVNYDDPFRNPG